MNNDKIVSMGIVRAKLKFRYYEKTKKFQKNSPNFSDIKYCLSNVKQIGRFLQIVVWLSQNI